MTNQIFDLIIRGGTVYDGSGGEPFVGDVADDGEILTRLLALNLEREVVGEYERHALLGAPASPSYAYMIAMTGCALRRGSLLDIACSLMASKIAMSDTLPDIRLTPKGRFCKTNFSSAIHG